MKHLIDIYILAQKELDDAYQWYQERQHGLGIRFMNAVDKKLQEIANNPQRYAKRNGNYRETMVDVFPYTIVYEILEKEKIVFVLHVFHTKRNPKLKYKF